MVRKIFRFFALWVRFVWESFSHNYSYWNWKSYFRSCCVQGYNEAASVSGHINGLSAHVLTINEKAVYTHFHSYRLNLVVAASCSIQYIRNVLDQIKELSFFFNFSETRQKMLDLSIENHTPDYLKKKLTTLFVAQDGLSRSQGRKILKIFVFQLYFV